MAGDAMDVPMFMTMKLEKFDGDPPRFRPGDKIPLWERAKAFFTGEVLVKEPVEIIERTYCLTNNEAMKMMEVKDGTS